MSRGGHLHRWTEAENAQLEQLRAGGLDWESVAARMPGRTQQACQQQYSIRHRKPRLKPRVAAASRQAPLVPILAVIQAAPGQPGARHVSTAVLLADAELRARIALQGLTAGLLGDPLPGRSALDKRRAGDGGGND